MALSIYKPADARDIKREILNNVSNRIYSALVKCGGSKELECEVPMMEGGDVHMVSRVYIDMDDIGEMAPIFYEDSNGYEDELMVIANVDGLCDIWENFM